MGTIKGPQTHILCLFFPKYLLKPQFLKFFKHAQNPHLVSFDGTLSFSGSSPKSLILLDTYVSKSA